MKKSTYRPVRPSTARRPVRGSRDCRECDGFPFHETWCKKDR